MPQYTLHRNYTLATTNGVISFVAGEPVHVPPQMERDAVSIGATCVDGEAPSLLNTPDAQSQPMGSDRDALVKDAITAILEANSPEDFGSAGMPTAKAVEKRVGFKVDRQLLAALWLELKSSKGE